MTYNIFAKGNLNSDYQEVIDAVQEINPDIFALQEVDNKHHSDIDVTKLISDSSSMHQNFHPFMNLIQELKLAMQCFIVLFLNQTI